MQTRSDITCWSPETATARRLLRIENSCSFTSCSCPKRPHVWPLACALRPQEIDRCCESCYGQNSPRIVHEAIGQVWTSGGIGDLDATSGEAIGCNWLAAGLVGGSHATLVSRPTSEAIDGRFTFPHLRVVVELEEPRKCSSLSIEVWEYPERRGLPIQLSVKGEPLGELGSTAAESLELRKGEFGRVKGAYGEKAATLSFVNRAPATEFREIGLENAPESVLGTLRLGKHSQMPGEVDRQGVRSTNDGETLEQVLDVRYSIALGLSGTPLFFQTTRLLKPSQRDAMSRRNARYKKHQLELIESFVTPICDGPTGASLLIFKWVSLLKDVCYLLVLSERLNRQEQYRMSLVSRN